MDECENMCKVITSGYCPYADGIDEDVKSCADCPWYNPEAEQRFFEEVTRMADRGKVFDAIRNCVTEPKCKDCPWEDCEKVGHKRVTVPVTLLLDALKLLKEQPEQKHGHWKGFTQSRYFGMDDDGEPIFRDGFFYVCSECRRKSIIRYPYCPKCGAKMDEEVKQND